MKVQYRDDDSFQKPAKKRIAEYKAYEDSVQKETSYPFQSSTKDQRVSKLDKPLPKDSKDPKSTIDSHEIQTAIGLHSEGINGNKSAVRKAFDLFKSLHEKEPNNTEIAAYYGSATALMGRDEANITKRMKYALSGLKILDSVVEKSPNLKLARFLRGNVCYRLPEMYFHRTDTAIEDFKFLINLYEEDNQILTISEYETVLNNLIKACTTLNRTEESKQYKELFQSISQMSNENKTSNINNPNSIGKKNISSNPVKEGQSQNESSIQTSELDEESLQIYQKALYGEAADVKKAIEHFSSLEEDFPKDPLIKAYSIDCNSLLGRNSINSFEMFSAGIKAMKALDALVNEHPNHMKIKKIRAYQSFRLPETFFRKTASAIKDFEELIGQYEKDQSNFTSEEYMEMLYSLGEGYERLGMNDEASSVWHKLLQKNPSKEMKDQINERQSILAFTPIEQKTLTVSQSEELFKVGKELLEIGVKGSKQAAQQALEIWEKAVEAFPDNSTAKTYHAASIALMGKFADEAQGLFGETIRGLKLLKNAFNKTNQTAELLLLRGNIYYALPEAFFHKTESAIKDFKAAKSLYKQGDQSITREQYLQLLVVLGIAYERSHFHDKAQKTWSLLAKEDEEGRYKEFLVSKGVVME